MKAKLAFYIASNGNLVDKAIAFYTRSKYSHVELIVDNQWYSTSPRDLQVRRKRIIPTDSRWDYIDVEIDYGYVMNFFNRTRGAKYDWLGIALSQFIPINVHYKSRWFCSEWCAEAMRLDEPHRYSPQDLYEEML